MEKQTARIIGYLGYRCPYCSREIKIPECKGEPITLEEYQRQVREEVKALKPKRKRG